MKNLTKFPLALLAVAMAGQASAAIVVDGNIDEWLSNKTTWATSSADIHATVEDQNGGLGVRLNPGYGGQAYDAEALFARIESGKLFIALATGHNPLTKTSGNNYGAGDFAIDFGKDGSYELGINFRVPNGTSAIDSFGQHAGVYAVSDWYYGLWDAAGNQTIPIQLIQLRSRVAKNWVMRHLPIQPLRRRAMAAMPTTVIISTK